MLAMNSSGRLSVYRSLQPAGRTEREAVRGHGAILLPMIVSPVVIYSWSPSISTSHVGNALSPDLVA